MGAGRPERPLAPPAHDAVRGDRYHRPPPTCRAQRISSRIASPAPALLSGTTIIVPSGFSVRNAAGSTVTPKLAVPPTGTTPNWPFSTPGAAGSYDAVLPNSVNTVLSVIEKAPTV